VLEDVGRFNNEDDVDDDDDSVVLLQFRRGGIADITDLCLITKDITSSVAGDDGRNSRGARGGALRALRLVEIRTILMLKMWRCSMYPTA
jgi:hypothetical protein